MPTAPVPKPCGPIARLWFSSKAYLLHQLRQCALEGTDRVNAKCETILTELLKVRTQVCLGLRRILAELASLGAAVAGSLRGSEGTAPALLSPRLSQVK